MYARKENIEEESLDWEAHSQQPLENMDAEIKKTEAVIPPVSKHRKTTLNNKASIDRRLNLKRKVTNFLDENSELSLIFSILIFPYIVGFLISYLLFYFYGGVSISSFLSLEHGNLHLELWSIGAYLFITVGVIWLVILVFLQKR